MVSEEKMAHTLHVVLDAIEKAGFVQFPDKGAALREAKRVGNGFLNQFKAAESAARQRISSQKMPPPEFSSEWETLYRKYLEEELRKLGG